ncbi:NAD-dependent epimerase/dehydratase family protein [Cyanobium sp. PCC 7001]|uniref:NAD-dependent epimerase/dehydratase family protein n=1 Tax=Cyanobium sp. PCC 7001 TaxID=180281 RepID=UPI0006818B2C|nr:NAD-dependent epimerase/dehydratase family protein [Cyanobium sp. PCC 7001]
MTQHSRAATGKAATGKTVAITGASGALGQALLQEWHRRGAQLIALCAGDRPLDLRDSNGAPIPLRQVQWCAGQENALRPLLAEVDVLVINHGINVHGARTPEAVSSSLEVNALSGWRLLELFASVVRERQALEANGTAAVHGQPEVWLNTSEAEIQPAVSPLYEISKRLIGQLLSLRALDLGRELTLRRLVLGPFRSALNPVGLMSPGFVASQVLWQAELGFRLIIVTPNPLTYVLMPLTTVGRWLYYSLFSRGSAREPAGPC